MVSWLVKWGSKKGGKKVLETVVPKIAKNLTTKRNIQDKVVKAADSGGKEAGVSPSVKASLEFKQSLSKFKVKESKKLKELSYEYDKLVDKKKSKDRKQKRKVFGAGAATIGGAVGAMEVGKRKSPKFKKFVESSVTIKDGKLGLKSKKD